MIEVDTVSIKRGNNSSERRSLVKRLFLGTITAGSWMLGKSFALEPKASLVSAKAIPGTSTLRSVLPAENYPKPRFLPASYRLNGVYTNRRGGFDVTGQGSEVVLWYRDPTIPNGYNRPLSIFLTSHPKNEFHGTAGKAPTLVPLLIEDTAVMGQYFAGMWFQQNWVTADVHALVFHFKGLTVGIRGCRLAAVSCDDLVKVANSLKF